MDDQISALLALAAALGLVLLNGFFVATEFAMVKVRPTRIDELIRAKKPGAHGVRTMVRSLDSYLSATQLGITLASLALGWLGEPAFERLIAPGLIWLSVPESWVHPLALTLAFSTITFLHIVVGEMAPKSLAIAKAESVAMFAAWPMRVIFFFFYPVVFVLIRIARLLLRAIGLRQLSEDAPDEFGHSEEEIKIIVAQARSAGMLSAERSDMLTKAMSLPSKTAHHLMVPRSEVAFLDINLNLEENLERVRTSEHTHFPLCVRELDEVVGVVDIRSVLFAMNRNLVAGSAPPVLLDFARPAVYFPETMSGERLLKEFRDRHIKMAVIVDEYGGASGIVTPADVVTVVMGELEDDDSTELIRLPGGAYDVEGTAPLEEVQEAIKTDLPTEDMRTVAGFLMERLGRMPRPGDRVYQGGFCFHVLEVTGPRVRRVRIQRETTGRAKAVAPAPSGERPPS